jgi:hypothetical protein
MVAHTFLFQKPLLFVFVSSGLSHRDDGKGYHLSQQAGIYRQEPWRITRPPGLLSFTSALSLNPADPQHNAVPLP